MKAGISIRYITIGFLAGVATLSAFAWFFGPKVVSHQEDPLTGRQLFEPVWLGATIHTRVEENEVSRWADQHSIKGIYPAQYGWSCVSISDRQWFGRTGIGCGGYGIPHRIFKGEIKCEPYNREETLQMDRSGIMAKRILSPTNWIAVGSWEFALARSKRVSAGKQRLMPTGSDRQFQSAHLLALALNLPSRSSKPEEKLGF